MNKAISFVKEAYVELKKVNWPSRKQTINYTLVVIGASIAVAVFLGILDMFFSSVIEKFLL
ncbi:MAG: preprotein translocase subunit SecE [Patescibacteria group bacterium]|nr:preprotein translocase subunit SecE [Patescibacteria group bacterium]